MTPSLSSSVIAERLSYWFQRDPGAPAIGAADGSMVTRAELRDLMQRGHRVLRAAGLGPADRVAVLLPEGFGTAISTLQVAGTCSLAPIRPGMGAAGWAAPLRGLSPSALVVSRDYPEAAAAAERLGVRVFHPEDLLAISSTDPSVGITIAEPELLLATSGSTGPPKWARIPQGRMVAGSMAMGRCMDLTPADRALLALPLDHAHGLASGLLLPLLSGGSLVIAGGFDAQRFLRAVKDHAITWFTAAPAMHRALLEQHAITPLGRGHQLRLVRSGTVALPPTVIAALSREFGVPVIEAYGMTECPHIACNPADSPRAGSVGRAVVEELAVIGADGLPVGVGEWGQVAIRGAPLMRDYLVPAGDRGVFRDGWLQTGDEGRLDADGFLYLRGRIVERINRGGTMVALASVDAALMTHSDVSQAVAFSVPHLTLGEDLAAAVVARPGAAVDEVELRRHLFNRLEPREVPSRIVVVDSIPVGSAGKVARGALGHMLADVLHPAYEPPRDSIEDFVVETFASALAARVPAGRRIGRLTNFFLEGGDSLTAMQVIASLAQSGWGEHPPTLLYENPTPADLAKALHPRGHLAGPSCLIELQRQGDRPPLFIVHGLSGELFNYLDLPQAFNPERPVFGLQATGYTAEMLAEIDVPELAGRHAEEIIERGGRGPVHLVGFSAGGWYAHAIAAALLERGTPVGLCAILDSDTGPLPDRRTRIALLAPRAARRVRRFIDLPDGTSGATYLLSALHRRAERLRLTALHRVQPERALSAAAESPSAATMFDPFRLLLQRNYRPARLPIAVDVFGPPIGLEILRITWSCYADGGVRLHPLFDNHTDFLRPDLMPALARQLKRALERAEHDLTTTP